MVSLAWTDTQDYLTGVSVTKSNKFNNLDPRMKDLFQKLMEQAQDNPCDTTLEKLLAFKKSLMSFETRWIKTAATYVALRHSA